MKQSVKRKLYIGLGGAGSMSILKIKENILAEYGEIPPCIKFLSIDCDELYAEGHLKSEHLHLRIFSEPNDDKINNWLSSSIRITKSGHGARQTKAMGRYAYWLNQLEIEKLIKNNLISLNSFNSILDSKYNVSDSPPIVEMVFSSAGGAGAGIYLDLSWFIRRVASDALIKASIIMGDLYTAYPATNNVRGNTYATMLEINYMQTIELNSNYSTHYLNDSKPISFKEEKLFDQIYVFDKILKNKMETDLDWVINSISTIILSENRENEYANYYDSNLLKSLLEDSNYKDDFEEQPNQEKFFLDKYFQKNITI